MDRSDEPECVGMTVPLETVASSSPGRARLALAIWAISLAGIAWIGLAGHEDGEGAPAGAATVAAIPASAATATPAAPATAAVSRGTVRSVAAPVGVRRTFGEDGLMGGIAFGDNVPGLSQADIERDGYRYYQANNRRVPGNRQAGPP